MLTPNDIKLIREALKPDFTGIREEIDAMEERLNKNMKEYVQESADAVIEGIEELLKEKDYDNRIKRLEQAVF